MAGMKCLVALAMLAVCYGATVPAAATVIKISTEDGVPNQCGGTHSIAKTAEYQIIATGDSPVVKCRFEFTAEADGDCKGVCYLFNSVAIFKTQKARLIVTSGGKTTTYNDTNPMNTLAICSTETQIDFTLQQDADYELKTKKNIQKYRFILDVFNHCGPRKDVDGMTFDEAIKHADGYHHGEDRETRERNNYVGGILLGFGLASIFLVVLLIAYCYVRNSPNRGPNRSVGMPKVGGFKKNMKPHKEPAPAQEMGVRYTATGEGGAKPEAKPLLTSADPEKPPAEPHVVSVEEGKE